MSFLKLKKKAKDNSLTSPQPKPFYKKRSWRVFFLVIGLLLVCGVSFLSYIYVNGSRVFNGNAGSLVRAIKGERLKGEDEGRVNIVVLGRGGDNHPGGLLTDSSMVLSLDTKNNKMAMISVPRDLRVDIKGHGKDKLNSAFAYGYNDYYAKNCNKKNQNSCRDGAVSAGAESSRETLSNVLGIPIHYYVVLDFEGFKELVNELGGLDINVDKAIYDPYYPDQNMKGYDPFYIKAGQHHMDGDTALKYARSRETTSDFDRARRQQQIISALKDKALNIGVLANPKKILDIVSIVGNHVRTDLSPADIKVLADKIKATGGQGNITSKVISSGNDEGGLLVSDSSSGTYYLVPKSGNFDQIKRFVRDIFGSSSTEDLKDANIEVLNGTNTLGLASKAADAIKKDGYTVTNIDTSSQKISKSLIYDYTGGKEKLTTEYLKKKFNADIVQKTQNDKNIDISLIIGSNYSSK